MHSKKVVAATIAGLAALALLGACDESTTAGPPVPQASAQDPNIRESASAAPDFDAGHTVHITAVGIQPKALTSLCCDPVVFKNETRSPVTVVFNISKISSGAIAPGATWSWTPPNPESVLYHLASDPKTFFQIQVEGND